MRDLPVPVIAAINGPAVSCTCFVEDRSHCWWFARLPLIFMYQVGAGLCLAVGGADIRVASASARFPSSQYLISAGFLFCTSLTWICVLCNEYGQWSSFWIQSPPGWGWLSPSWVYTLAWRRLIFSLLLLDRRWWDNFLGGLPIAKCYTGFKELLSPMYSRTICTENVIQVSRKEVFLWILVDVYNIDTINLFPLQFLHLFHPILVISFSHCDNRLIPYWVIVETVLFGRVHFHHHLNPRGFLTSQFGESLARAES